MKVIFLDLDGVLNSKKYDRIRDWSAQTSIDESRLPILEKIIAATGAELVFSSTWRVHWDKDETRCDDDGRYINETLGKFGLKLFDKTPQLGLFYSRAEEVQNWLKYPPAPVESFVILDDYGFGWGALADRLVKTNENDWGLSDADALKAIKLLNERN